ARKARHRLAEGEGGVRSLPQGRGGREDRDFVRPQTRDHVGARLCEARRDHGANGSCRMNKPVLVVGGGPAGLSAAHALATMGQPVVLVDKVDRLGGAPILSGYAKLVPSGEWAKDAIGGMVRRVET